MGVRCDRLPASHRALALMIGALVATAIVLTATPVIAHSWYPKKCCNEQDCFPATRIERLSDKRLQVTAGHITVVIPLGFPALPSQDNNAHVCVYRDIMGRYHPRCLFLPGVG